MRKRLLLALCLGAAACSNADKPTATTPTATPTPGSPVAAPAVPLRTVITAASGLRLRATAAADGQEVTRLPLATKLLVNAQQGEWLHAKTADDQEGFVAAAMVRELDPAHADDMYITLFKERAANAKLTFPDRADLYVALKRTAQEIKDENKKAEIELLRIQALKAAVEATATEAEPDAQMKGFLNQHKDDVVYSEPGGSWLPSADPLWKSAETYKATPSGESIAWEAATTPLPGECEGFFDCMLSWINMSKGAYLKLFPTGPHAAEALSDYAQIEAPTSKNEVEDWDGETYQGIDDSFKEAEAIIAKCDPAARKTAEAKLAKAKRTIKKLAGAK